MNLELNYEGFEQNLVYSGELMDGIAYRFMFDNKFGASVVKHRFSYGSTYDLWELAVLEYGDDINDCHITYDTGITSEVLGYLTDDEVRETLEKIKNI